MAQGWMRGGCQSTGRIDRHIKYVRCKSERDEGMKEIRMQQQGVHDLQIPCSEVGCEIVEGK